ncbi:Acyl carrier protein [bioreactor metagenome]|uniref:Acyl carrier protein n=1 Tax=bioreactor metagenome TaxID=1076179 RepID=A0A645FVR2_9ZZZZ
MAFEKIRSIIAKQLDIDESKVTEDANLIEDLKADSLDVVELIMDLEQEFNIEVPDEDLSKIVTVGDVVKYVTARLG